MTRTQVKGTAIHLIKVRQYGNNRSIAIPQDVSESAGLVDGFYSAVVAIGPCVIVARVTQNTRDGVEAELRHAVNRAITEWEIAQDDPKPVPAPAA